MKKVLAMLLALCMMLGVAGMAAAEEEIVTLKWVTVGNGMPANYDSWIAQVNEYVGEKIGVNIEMQVIGWGDWEPRRNVIINTNLFLLIPEGISASCVSELGSQIVFTSFSATTLFALLSAIHIL